jgi:hypothetical protein
MPDTPTPAPATREHLEEAKRELEEALKRPITRKRIQQAATKIARDLESDIQRVESGKTHRNGANGNGVHK